MRISLQEREPLCQRARQLLEAFHFVGHNDPAEIIWTGLTPVRPCEGCLVIVTPCTGIDHIPLDECERLGIEVLSLKGETEFLETVHATAEHTIALMLAMLRRIHLAAHYGERLIRRELHGKTVLIVGRGRVGKQVGDLLQAFGCLVLYADKESPLDELLPLADIVSVHVDLNETTRGMFDSSRFCQMQYGSYFVNTSRGQVANTDHLRAALEHGNLAGAAVDFSVDFEHVKLLQTPHIGGYTVESVEKTEVFMASKLITWTNSREAALTQSAAHR